MNINEFPLYQIIADKKILSEAGFARKYGITKSKIKTDGRSVEGTPEDRKEDRAAEKNLGITTKKWEGSPEDQEQDYLLAKRLHKEALNEDPTDKRKKVIDDAYIARHREVMDKFGGKFLKTSPEHKGEYGEGYVIGHDHKKKGHVLLQVNKSTGIRKGRNDQTASISVHEKHLVDPYVQNSGKKSMKEETLDELSKETKFSYFSKAATERGKADKEGDEKTLKKRDRGLNRLLNPLPKKKGDVVREDELNELSKKTLGNYVKIAAKQATGLGILSGEKKISSHGSRKLSNRVDGIDKAVTKLTKEETLEEKNWIAGAIKHPGSLHKELGVPAGKDIPAGKLEKAAHASGKEGKRARLALTLKKMHEDTLTEARRGRPPKDPAARAVYDSAHKEEQEHIVSQLRKAASISGHPVHFMNGEKHVIPASKIYRALDIHDSAKPYEKQSIAHYLHHSPKTFHQVIGEEIVDLDEAQEDYHHYIGHNVLSGDPKHKKLMHPKPFNTRRDAQEHIEDNRLNNARIYTVRKSDGRITDIKNHGPTANSGGYPYRPGIGDHKNIRDLKESLDEGKTFKDNKYGSDRQKSRELWKKISRKKKSERQDCNMKEDLSESRPYHGGYTSYSHKEVLQKVRDGEWEAHHDVEPNKLIDVTMHGKRSSKRKMIHIHEDAEVLDELSKDTLKSYLGKAGKERSKLSARVRKAEDKGRALRSKSLKANNPNDEKYSHGDKLYHKYTKRADGMGLARAKIKGSGPANPDERVSAGTSRKQVRVPASESIEIDEAVPSQKASIVALNRKTARQILNNTKKINLVWKAGKIKTDTNT